MRIDLNKATRLIGHASSFPALDDFLLGELGILQRVMIKDIPQTELKTAAGLIRFGFSYHQQEKPLRSDGCMVFDAIHIDQIPQAVELILPFGLRMDMCEEELVSVLGKPCKRDKHQGTLVFNKAIPQLDLTFTLNKKNGAIAALHICLKKNPEPFEPVAECADAGIENIADLLLLALERGNDDAALRSAFAEHGLFNWPKEPTPEDHDKTCRQAERVLSYWRYGFRLDFSERQEYTQRYGKAKTAGALVAHSLVFYLQAAEGYRAFSGAAPFGLTADMTPDAVERHLGRYRATRNFSAMYVVRADLFWIGSYVVNLFYQPENGRLQSLCVRPKNRHEQGQPQDTELDWLAYAVMMQCATPKAEIEAYAARTAGLPEEGALDEPDNTGRSRKNLNVRLHFSQTEVLRSVLFERFGERGEEGEEGWRGTLPFGLTFSDTPEQVLSKLPVPAEEKNTSVSGLDAHYIVRHTGFEYVIYLDLMDWQLNSISVRLIPVETAAKEAQRNAPDDIADDFAEQANERAQNLTEDADEDESTGNLQDIPSLPQTLSSTSIYFASGCAIDRDSYCLLSHVGAISTLLVLDEAACWQWEKLPELEESSYSCLFEPAAAGEKPRFWAMDMRGHLACYQPDENEHQTEIILPEEDVIFNNLRRVGEHLYACADAGRIYRRPHAAPGQGVWELLNQGLEAVQDNIEDVNGQADDDLYAVGADGLLAHYDGHRWHLLSHPLNQNKLHFIFVQTPTAIWLLGENGALLRGNARAGFQRYPATVDEVDWDDFSAMTILQGQVLLGASDGLYHLEEGQAKRLAVSDELELVQVKALDVADDVLWLLAHDKLLRLDMADDRLWRCIHPPIQQAIGNHETSTPVPGSGMLFYCGCAIDSDHFYLAATTDAYDDDIHTSFMLLYGRDNPPDNQWPWHELRNWDVNAVCTSQLADGSPYALWAISQDGMVECYQGDVAQVERIDSSYQGDGCDHGAPFKKIRQIGNALYVCGQAGHIFRRTLDDTDNSWQVWDEWPRQNTRIAALSMISEQMRSAWDNDRAAYYPKADDLKAIEKNLLCLYDINGLSEDDIYTVGSQGFIAHYNGRNWQPLASGTDASLLSIHIAAQDDIWITGSDCTLLRGNAKEGFAPVALDNPKQDSGIFCLAAYQGALYIGLCDGIYRLQNTALERLAVNDEIKSGNIIALEAKDGVLWAIDASGAWSDWQGKLLRFDGETWECRQHPIVQTPLDE